MRFAVMLSFVVSTILAATTHAQLHVPGDHDTVQAAIDASPPGGVVIVHGGTWTSLTITKPLTLVGDPAPLIRGICGDSNPAKPALRLDGPGQGSVTLENLRLIYEGLTSSCSSLDPLVLGGGFDQLVVLSSELRGSDACCDETLAGDAAIYVDVGSLLVSQSTIVGGSSSTDFFACHGTSCWAADGQPGIVAPSSSVVILDSEISGGDAQTLTFASHTGCPTTCEDIANGNGGAGVIAESLFVANSTILGGAGGTHSCDNTSFVCIKPNGAPIVSGQVEHLGNSLIASGALPLGGSWDLTWFASSPVALLALSPTATAPLLVGAKGWLFMDADTIVLRPIPGGGIQSRTFAIPNEPALVGLLITAQVYDSATGLTRPVTAPVLP